MANNYTQFSILLNVHKPELVESVSEFLDDIDYDDLISDGESGKQTLPEELFSKEDVQWMRNNIDEYGGIDGWSHNDGKLWVYSEEGANLEVVTFILQKLLSANAISGNYYKHNAILITWANTCSKMRVDEFSGGACLITKDEIHWQEDWCQWANDILGKS